MNIRHAGAIAGLVAGALMSSCASSAKPFGLSEPESKPAVRVVISGDVEVHYDQAMQGWAVSADLSLLNPSIYDLEIGRVWLVIKGADNSSFAEPVEANWLRDLWGDTRLRARAQRTVPARFYTRYVPPPADYRTIVEAWVEAEAPDGSAVQAHTSVQGALKNSDGTRMPN